MIEQVLNEVQRAAEKFPTWPSDALHALAVLGEEYGELTKAMLQMTYEPHKTSPDEVRKEAIQTAAMALRLVMSLDRYTYTRCPQHEQDSKHTLPVSPYGPTHRCRLCGAMWRYWSAIDSWSLLSPSCGSCCDNESIGDQVDALMIVDSCETQNGGLKDA